jgi:hypothetical protein
MHSFFGGWAGGPGLALRPGFCGRGKKLLAEGRASPCLEGETWATLDLLMGWGMPAGIVPQGRLQVAQDEILGYRSG